MEPVTAIRTGTAIWKIAKPITRIKRALNKRRARKGKPLLEINQEKDLKALIGSLFSKTIWFGVLTEVWGIAQVFMANGDFSVEAIVTMVSGVVIIVLRAVTNKPLAEK